MFPVDSAYAHVIPSTEPHRLASETLHEDLCVLVCLLVALRQGEHVRRTDEDVLDRVLVRASRGRRGEAARRTCSQ